MFPPNLSYKVSFASYERNADEIYYNMSKVYGENFKNNGNVREYYRKM